MVNNNTNQNNVNNGGGSKRPDTGDRNLENILKNMIKKLPSTVMPEPDAFMSVQF